MKRTNNGIAYQALPHPNLITPQRPGNSVFHTKCRKNGFLRKYFVIPGRFHTLHLKLLSGGAASGGLNEL
ncbi:CLUMA_CG001129, isoform A [Clunio marinus]|uniref:CLUMA_CG001129, isoform A n=1 Tax=Clunio marinus TaxID=568069 RepID=A0A1J1HH31_9DIPT|nr:CLUMA_CG001129, isoform A [Clunio marinus]